MGYWANRKALKEKAKREKWEEEQASNVHQGRKKGYVPRGKRTYTLEETTDIIHDLEMKVASLSGKIASLESNKTDNWKVQQNKEGKTTWIKYSSIKYVGEIYADGPGNSRYFDAIIDGVKTVFKAESEEEANELKLGLLDVDRIEEFDADKQEEMFGERKDSKEAVQEANNKK